MQTYRMRSRSCVTELSRSYLEAITELSESYREAGTELSRGYHGAEAGLMNFLCFSTAAKVQSGTSQSKIGTSVNLGKSGDLVVLERGVFDVHDGFRVQDSGFRVQGSGFRVQGSGFRVHGSGFRAQGSGFRVQGSRPRRF